MDWEGWDLDKTRSVQNPYFQTPLKFVAVVKDELYTFWEDGFMVRGVQI